MAVAVGSGLGAIARAAFGAWIDRQASGVFPFGTFAVNLTGCFIIGFLYASLAVVTGPHALPIVFLGTGFLGGYTTYSSFVFQSLSLASERELLFAGLNVGLTLIGCLATVSIGWILGTKLITA